MKTENNLCKPVHCEPASTVTTQLASKTSPIARDIEVDVSGVYLNSGQDLPSKEDFIFP